MDKRWCLYLSGTSTCAGRCERGNGYASPVMSETDLRCLDTYGQPPSSPVLDWLPLLAGFVAAVSISSMMCPVPRPQTLSGSAALAISTKYVLMIIAASAVAFVGVHAITPAKSNMGFSVVMLRFLRLSDRTGPSGWPLYWLQA